MATPHQPTGIRWCAVARAFGDMGLIRVGALITVNTVHIYFCLHMFEQCSRVYIMHAKFHQNLSRGSESYKFPSSNDS